MVETLKHMRGLARAAVRSPDQIVRLQALEIIRGLSHRWRAQIQALQAWVQNSVAFIRDPPGVELVQTPEKTLELRAGDCDDQATLLAALLEAAGHPARFIALGFNGKPFSHVLVQTLDGREWVAAETILKKPLGWFPGNVTSRYLLKV